MRNQFWTMFTAGAVLFSAACVGVSHWNFSNARTEAAVLRQELAAAQRDLANARGRKTPPPGTSGPADADRKGTALHAENTGRNPTLAVRNNNPCNIKTPRGGAQWVGQVGTDKYGHAIFGAPEHGVRAAANVLLNYYAKHGLDTLDGILSRFCEGNRSTYAAFLSSRLRIEPDKPFDVLQRLPELLHAMARFESGREWPRELFTGYSLVATAYERGRQ